MRQGLVLAAAVVLGLSGTTVTEAAATPGPRHREPATHQAPRCGLTPSTDSRGPDRVASCLQAGVTVAGAVAVGQTTDVAFTVKAQGDQQDVAITAELPAGLAWARVPAGFTVTGSADAAPASGGTWNRITARRDIADGRTLDFSAQVKGVRAGPASINVRARGTGSGTPGGDADTWLTVGGEGFDASLTVAAARESGTAALPEGVTPQPLYPHLRHQSVGTRGLPQPHSDDPDGTPGVRATSCVRGTWNYADHNGNFRQSANFQVQVWDSDPIGDDLLGTVMTGASGDYNVCFDNDDGIGGGGNDVFVRFVAESPLWNVQRDDEEPYLFRTETRDDVADGSTTDFGAQRPVTQNLMPVVELYDQVNAASDWTPGDCWDRLDRECRRIPVNWTPTSNLGDHYCSEEGGPDCPRENEIYLRGNANTSTTTAIHEVGHGVMDDVYDDQYPRTNCPNPHAIQGQSEPGCAWSEGFAEWYPAQVTGAPTYVFPGGGADAGRTLNLEDPTWGTTGWDTGDDTEGRVAGAMIDLVDGGARDERYWDRHGEPATAIWNTFLRHRSANFRDFFVVHRAADGGDVSDARGKASLFQNTIDFDFRDPLGDYAELERPRAIVPHNFGFTTTVAFWQVVAVRPDGGEQNLELFDDRNQTRSLGTGNQPGADTEFIAVDSNRRALGDYYPRVTQAGGAGGYRIELAQGTTQLIDRETFRMAAGDVVVVRDVLLHQGREVTIAVDPATTGQNPELYLVGSVPGQPDTYVRNRAQAVAQSTGGGAGATETITFTAPSTGFYGVVVINRSGGGSYELSRQGG
ncbi:hypothetical protein [Saccharothrix violaceirubra]|uniref:Uncharacterized protein n=1 Tax=Saccharothrix violaceirubra TaxID=413306 RepID=A0A7W7WW29_9PSEU|nr:hypothetical protein [Saccharothrix violaceirubra]MBB4965537.1 hypothetical protein [Saccharothrix violaceirubra]